MSIANPQFTGATLRSCLVREFDFLPDSQQKVAAWFLAEGGRYPGNSLADVAEKADVSPSAVVRMCQALGLRGFREFRLRWALEETTRPNRPNGLDTSGAFHSVYMAIQETNELLRPDQVENAARIICQAPQLFIYGSGGSGLVGQLAAASLWGTGCRALALSDVALRSSSYDITGEGTAVLVISHRGFWCDLIPRLQSDRSRNIKIIVITSSANSDLAKLADVLLLTGCRVGRDNRGLDTSAARVAQTAAVQVLVEAVMRVKACNLRA